MVELAVMIPVLVGFLYGLLVTMSYVKDEVTAGYAVRQGARLAAEEGGALTNPGATQSQIDADIIKNVLAVTSRGLVDARLDEIDIYGATAADGTLQGTDLVDKFTGTGSAMSTQTFTLTNRVQTPPNETSIGVRLAWTFLPKTGFNYPQVAVVNYAVMKAAPVTT
jgi:hypothetical protein